MIVLQLVAVIVLWFAALLFWNLGSLRLTTLASLRGLGRIVAGAALAFAALYLLDRSFPGFTPREFSYFAIGSFLVALVCDFLLGDDLRRMVRRA